MPVRLQTFPPGMDVATGDDEALLGIRKEREQLGRRIADLRPHSFKRLELQVRMRELTARQLELETKAGKARTS